MAGNRGGARAGAGRPRNADKYTTEIEAASDLAAKHLNEAMQVIVNAVRSGDVKAAMYLIDRVMGRPVQQNVNNDTVTADIEMTLPNVQYNLTAGDLSDDLLHVQRGPK